MADKQQVARRVMLGALELQYQDMRKCLFKAFMARDTWMESMGGLRGEIMQHAANSSESDYSGDEHRWEIEVGYKRDNQWEVNKFSQPGFGGQEIQHQLLSMPTNSSLSFYCGMSCGFPVILCFNKIERDGQVMLQVHTKVEWREGYDTSLQCSESAVISAIIKTKSFKGREKPQWWKKKPDLISLDGVFRME